MPVNRPGPLKRHVAPQYRYNLLGYLQRRFLLPLHCLFANQARSQPLFYYPLKISLEAAAANIAPTSDVRFSRLMPIAGGMFREGIRYASITVGLEVLAQAQMQGTDTGGIITVDAEFFIGLTENPINISMDKIRKGETNVKNPMFLSMVMTQARAVEGGTTSRLTMAQAARDSLRDCHDLLQAWKNASPCLTHAESSEATTGSFGEFATFDFDFDLNFFMPEMDL